MGIDYRTTVYGVNGTPRRLTPVVGDMGTIRTELRNPPTCREVVKPPRGESGGGRGSIDLPKMEREGVGDAGAEGQHPNDGASGDVHGTRHRGG